MREAMHIVSAGLSLPDPLEAADHRHTRYTTQIPTTTATIFPNVDRMLLRLRSQRLSGKTRVLVSMLGGSRYGCLAFALTMHEQRVTLEACRQGVSAAL